MHQNEVAANNCPARSSTLSKSGSFTIRPARSEQDFQATIELIKAHTSSLNLDLNFQNFDDEMSLFPYKYAPPEGEILLAIDDQLTGAGEGEVLGCICLKSLMHNYKSLDDTSSPRQIKPSGEQRSCEMKRLYVLPSARKRGVGRALVTAFIETAREKGYTDIKLDTLRHMVAPLQLYRDMGFTDIEQYYDTPPELDTVYLGLNL